MSHHLALQQILRTLSRDTSPIEIGSGKHIQKKTCFFSFALIQV